MNTALLKDRVLKVVPDTLNLEHEKYKVFVHGTRTVVLYLILFSVVTFQLLQKEFINVSVWLPVYLTLFPAFVLNSIYLFYFQYFKNKNWLDGFLFVVDALVFTGLLSFTGAEGSLFFLLFLINIVLAGILFSKTGVYFVVSMSSIFYSIALLLDASFIGQNLYVSLFFNNAALLSVGFLSGILSEQFSFFGERIQQSEKKIEALEEINTLIVSNISSGLITIDKKMSISTANSSAERILEDEKLTGKSLSSVFPAVFQSIQSRQATSGITEPVRMEIAFESHEGLNMTFETVISPLMDSTGDSQGFLILFQDLTEIKAMEKQVRQQDKLAAVGQLAAGIAHEIRNPLASISGSIQLLVADPDTLKSEDLKLMRIVLREIDRLNGLISEFLEFVRPDVQATESVDVNRLLQEVLEMVRFNKNLPEGVDQLTEFHSQSPILGHSDKLKQAFLNIVINAYQAMEKSDLREIRVTVKDENQQVSVCIEDTGQGIEEKTLERIFEPFLTTKAKGTGLGLAITHKVLESHGANTSVSSKVGKGTRFEIVFPLGTGPQPKEEQNKEQVFGMA